MISNTACLFPQPPSGRAVIRHRACLFAPRMARVSAFVPPCLLTARGNVPHLYKNSPGCMNNHGRTFPELVICSPVLTHAPGGTILQMFPRAWWCTRGNICSPVLGRAPGGTFLRICIRMCSPVLGHAPRIPRVSALVPPCLLTAREHF